LSDDRLASDNQVRTLVRAFAILEQFSLRRPELSLSEVSEVAALSKSTAHRLLGTLEQLGLVSSSQESGYYRLGLKAFLIGDIAAGTMPLLKEADPLLAVLTNKTDESSFLLVPDNDKALCLRRLDGERPSRLLITDVGVRSAFNCGSAQRVLLAYLPEEHWDEVVTRHVHPVTQYSLVTRDDLERDRSDIRKRGYCIAREDVVLQVWGLGVPVHDASGTVIAAISISGTVNHFSAERLPTLVRTVLDTGEELSQRLGFAS
jgi:IclR family transcriptional regulator, KDG regulon repressor